MHRRSRPPVSKRVGNLVSRSTILLLFNVTLFRIHDRCWFLCRRTLNNNNLTSLPRDLFEPLSRLRVLRLSENKWLCDCHLAWLGRFLRRHARAGSPLAANGYLPRCHAPFGLRIKAVSELLDTEFKCTGKPLSFIDFSPSDSPVNRRAGFLFSLLKETIWYTGGCDCFGNYVDVASAPPQSQFKLK